jgi:hypothetical protein
MIDRRLERLADRIHQAARIKPNVDKALAERLAHCDTTTHNETGITTGELNDPVIRRVLARSDIMNRATNITNAVDAVEQALNQLDTALRAGYRHTPPPTNDHPTCDGGDPSTWGDPTCGEYCEHYRRGDNSIGYRDLCSKHRKRRTMWERDNVPHEETRTNTDNS